MISDWFYRDNMQFSLVILLVCTTAMAASTENCWWTECRPDQLAATSCVEYNRTEKAREKCDDGFKYRCCATADEPTAEEYLTDQCWWSECRPKDQTDRECPSHSVRSQTLACAEGGEQYQCCMKKSALLEYYNNFPNHMRNRIITEYLNSESKKHQFSDSRSSEYEQKTISEKKPYDYGSADNIDGSDVESVVENQEHPIKDIQLSSRNCDDNKRVVGYYTFWSAKDMSSEMMEKLTHVIYAFLMTQADGTVDFDSPASLEKLQRLMELRKSHPQVKIMFAVGGMSDSQHFSSILASSESRSTFMDSIVKHITDNDFDGIDIDWEYPVISGGPQDNENFVLFMKDLRGALTARQELTARAEPYLISFAGPPGQWSIDPGFNLPDLLQHADFVNVMAYDYFGVWGNTKWSEYTGPPAPLQTGTPSDFPIDFSHANVDWTIGYYVEKINSPEKINMGVPFYGYFWKNVGDPIDANDGMWRKAEPVDGEYQGGATAWHDIQADHLSDSRFQQMFHEQCKSPYAWNEETKVFLGYENQESLKFKVDYVNEKNLGGLMIWSVDQDDDSLTLLSTLQSVHLCEQSNPNDEH